MIVQKTTGKVVVQAGFRIWPDLTILSGCGNERLRVPRSKHFPETNPLSTPGFPLQPQANRPE
jgi:hypothetical protein